MNEVLQKIANGFAMSIWGVLPIYLLIMVFGVAILVKRKKYDRVEPLEEICNQRKFNKTEQIFRPNDYIGEIWGLFCLTIVSFPAIVLANVNNLGYIESAIENLDIVSGITLGITGIVSSIAVVIIVFDKKYYLCFSIREVLQENRIPESLFIVIFSCIVVVCSIIGLLDETVVTLWDLGLLFVLEIAFFYNIICSAYSLFTIVRVMFIGTKKELKLLDKLYRFFWIQRIDTLSFEKKKWKKGAILLNLEYLIEKYSEICKQIKTDEIEEIEFVTTLGRYNEKWYKKARKYCLKVAMILGSISIVYDLICYKQVAVFLFLCNMGIILAIAILTEKNIPAVRLVILRLCLDTWGYYIKKNDGEEIFSPLISLRITKKYDIFFRRMNSINAFFAILLEYANKKESLVTVEELTKYIDLSEEKNMFELFPIFSIGYLYFEKGIRVEQVKKLYQLLKLSEKEIAIFKRMINSQLFYMKIHSSEGLFEYSKKMQEYVKWMQDIG